MFVLGMELEHEIEYFKKVIYLEPLTIRWGSLTQAVIFSNLKEVTRMKDAAKKCAGSNETLQIYEITLTKKEN